MYMHNLSNKNCAVMIERIVDVKNIRYNVKTTKDYKLYLTSIIKYIDSRWKCIHFKQTIPD